MTELLEKVLSQNGFAVTVAISSLIGLYFLLKWANGFISKASARSDAREDALMAIIDKQNNTLDVHTNQAREFHIEMKTASEYQRKEHEKMISQLDEITITLGRINGYK